MARRRRGAGRRQQRLDATAEVVHGEGVEDAAVVARDDAEIVEARAQLRFRLAIHADEEGRRLVALRRVEGEAAVAQRLHRRVRRELAGDEAVGLREPEARRHDDRLAGAPAVLLKIVRDAGDDVVPAGPQVALAVAVAVDRVGAVARRHELAARPSRPRRSPGRSRIELLLARQQQELLELGAEISRARRVVEGERRERVEHAVLAGDAAVERLDADDADDHVRRDAGVLVRPCRASSRCSGQNATPASMRSSVRKWSRYCVQGMTSSAGLRHQLDDARLAGSPPRAFASSQAASKPCSVCHLRRRTRCTSSRVEVERVRPEARPPRGQWPAMAHSSDRCRVRHPHRHELPLECSDIRIPKPAIRVTIEVPP